MRTAFRNMRLFLDWKLVQWWCNCFLQKSLRCIIRFWYSHFFSLSVSPLVEIYHLLVDDKLILLASVGAFRKPRLLIFCMAGYNFLCSVEAFCLLTDFLSYCLKLLRCIIRFKCLCLSCVSSCFSLNRFNLWILILSESAMRERKRFRGGSKQGTPSKEIPACSTPGSTEQRHRDARDVQLSTKKVCALYLYLKYRHTTFFAKIELIVSMIIKEKKLARGLQISPVVFYGSPNGVPPKRPSSLLRLLQDIRVDLAEQHNLKQRYLCDTKAFEVWFNQLFLRLFSYLIYFLCDVEDCAIWFPI